MILTPAQLGAAWLTTRLRSRSAWDAAGTYTVQVLHAAAGGEPRSAMRLNTSELIQRRRGLEDGARVRRPGSRRGRAR